MVAEGGVTGIRQVFHMEELLRLGDAPGGERSGFCLFIHNIVRVDVGEMCIRDRLYSEQHRATALGARVLLGRGIHAAGSESDFDSGQMKITL